MNTDIIFIDDEEDILNLIRLKFRKVFKKSNLNLNLFQTARDFEAYIKTSEADVLSIVSDINMPDNNVLELIKEYRDNFRFVLVYLCSAYDQDQFKDMIEDNNVKFFFKKPLDIDNIKDRLIFDLDERGVLTSSPDL